MFVLFIFLILIAFIQRFTLKFWHEKLTLSKYNEYLSEINFYSTLKPLKTHLVFKKIFKCSELG